jgi:hypothetical protein
MKPAVIHLGCCCQAAYKNFVWLACCGYSSRLSMARRNAATFWFVREGAGTWAAKLITVASKRTGTHTAAKSRVLHDAGRVPLRRLLSR